MQKGARLLLATFGSAHAASLACLDDAPGLRPLAVATLAPLAGELAFRTLGWSMCRASRSAVAVSLPLICAMLIAHTRGYALPLVFVIQLLAATYLFAHHPPSPTWTKWLTLVAGLGATRYASARLSTPSWISNTLISEWTRHQHLLVLEDKQSLQLYIDGHPQFDSRDERAYHAALVDPVLKVAASRVLILGGGDGLAARSLLEGASGPIHITIVDHDQGIFELFTRHRALKSLNRGALRDGRVACVTSDAQTFLEASAGSFDAIILDLPDPHAPGMDTVYVASFVRAIAAHLRPEGVIVAQAASLNGELASFRLVHDLFAAEGLTVTSYTACVPSFGGDAAFVLARVDSERSPPLAAA